MTNQTFATTGQLSAVGFKIASTVTRVLGEGNFTFDQAQHLVLSDEKELEKLTEKFCSEVLGVNVDPWVEEKRRIEKFYRKFFNIKVLWRWSEISPPASTEAMKRLEVIFPDITDDDAFTAYAEEFGQDAVWKYYQSITQSIASQQERPKGPYAFAHVGGDEPDMLNMSYNDGINAGIKFMIPKEGIIAAFRHRTETCKMYDVKGLTRFAALDDDGYAMLMRRLGDGRFRVSFDSRGRRNAEGGLRQVSF